MSKEKKPPVFTLQGKYSIYDMSTDARPCFQARVLQKGTKKRESQRFPTMAKAKAWADDKSAKFELGIDQAGTATITGRLEEYMGWMRGMHRNASYIEQTQWSLRLLLAAGIDNLKHDSVIARTSAVMNNLKNSLKGGTPQDLGASTKARIVAQLRCFGNWMCHPTRRYLALNPFKGVPVPRVPKKMRPVFSIAECKLLASAAALRTEEGLHWAIRLYTGMRAKEATWLRWEHVLYSSRRIRVSTRDDLDICEAAALATPGRKNRHIGKTLKGEYERLAIMQEELAEILEARRGEPKQYVFSAAIRRRHQCTEARCYARHLKSLGIPLDGRNPHRLRATCASILLAGGLDVYQLGEHMGHTLVSTTQEYVRSASNFREECHGWGGRLYFRGTAPCHFRATGSGTVGSNQVDAPPAPEGELPGDEELFILLPSTSDIFRDDQAHASASAASGLENSRSTITVSRPENSRLLKAIIGNDLREDTDDVPLT